MVEVGANVARLQRDLGKMNQQITSATKQFSSAFKGVGLAIGGAFSVAAITGFFKEGMRQNMEWEKRLNRTTALLKATGDAVGMTTRQLAAFADQRDLSTLGDKDGILDAINVMQTFKSVYGETFKESIKVAQDMAAVMGTDVKQAAIQLGKALEDPVSQMNALKRSGISFTDQQKDMITALVESGDKVKAQAMLLKMLKDQLGGAAEGEAKGMAGSVDTLSHNWRELTETMANTSAAKSGIDALAEAIDGMTRSLKEMTGQDEIGRLTRELAAYAEVQQSVNYSGRGAAMPSTARGQAQSAYARQVMEEKRLQLAMLQSDEEARAREEEDVARMAAIKAKEAAQAEAKAMAEKRATKEMAEQLKIAKELTGSQQGLLYQAQANRDQGNTPSLWEWNGREQRIDENAIASAQYEAQQEWEKRTQDNVAATRNLADEAKNAFLDYARTAADVAGNAASAFNASMRSMTDAIVSFAMTGKDSFSAMATSIIADILRMTVQSNITGPIANVLGSALSSVFSAGPTMFSGQSSYDLQASGMTMNAAMNVPRAHGGLIDEPVIGIGQRTGRSWSFGETGNEWVSPAGGGDASGGVQVIINQAPAGTTVTESRGAGNLRQIIVEVGKALAEDVRGGGALGKAIGSTYGIRRQGRLA